MLGHRARALVLRELQHAEGGACGAVLGAEAIQLARELGLVALARQKAHGLGAEHGLPLGLQGGQLLLEALL